MDSLLENLRNMALESDRIVKERFTKQYTCVICFKENLHYSTCLNMSYFNTNTKGITRGVTLSQVAMYVCSEECRYKYVKNGGIPYALLMEKVGIPQRYRERRLTDWQDNPIYEPINQWLESSNLKGFYILGAPGSGKTSFAAALAYELRKREFTVSFQNASYVTMMANSFAASNQPEDTQHFVTALSNFDVVILDDLAKHHLTLGGKELMFQMFSTLYDKNSCLIITSNYTPDETAPQIDERLQSRLNEMCQRINFKGEDKRKNGVTTEGQNTSQ